MPNPLSDALRCLEQALASLDAARAHLPAHPRTPAALGAYSSLAEAVPRVRMALKHVEGMEREQEKRDG